MKAAALSVVCGALSVCPPAGPSAGEKRELMGSIKMAGSTSMGKLAEALAERFMELYPAVAVSVEYIGTGAGIEAVLSGTVDIGNSSRRLKAKEREQGAVEIPVAIDGIAVCVDRENRVQGLTRRQLADIYTGRITDWSQAGGESIPIVVIGQEAGSGTREAFEEFLRTENACVYAGELGSAGAVKAKVSATPGAVGYVSLDVVDGSVRALALDGAAPDIRNIRAGKYPLARPFLMIVRGRQGRPGEQDRIGEQDRPEMRSRAGEWGEPGEPDRLERESALLSAWFDYVLGEEGQAIVERMGLAAGALAEQSGSAPGESAGWPEPAAGESAEHPRTVMPLREAAGKGGGR